MLSTEGTPQSASFGQLPWRELVRTSGFEKHKTSLAAKLLLQEVKAFSVSHIGSTLAAHRKAQNQLTLFECSREADHFFFSGLKSLHSFFSAFGAGRFSEILC